MAIPRSLIEEIASSINLADYVRSRGIDLHDQGSSAKAKCPFHDDGKTPSFSIPVEKQYFRCFGCDASGDIFNFIQRFDGVDFIESVRSAASYAGIIIPEEEIFSPELAWARQERERLNVIYLQAARYCHRVLPSDLRQHLRDHYGFEDWFIDEKLIGYDDGKLFFYLQRELGFDRDELLSTGLFTQSQNGRVRDFMYTRLVFWYWKRGMPVYAIGRETEYTMALEDYEEFESGRKYKKLLTYHKERRPYVSQEVENKFIYNEDLFLNPATRPKYGVIVEGITDAMLGEQKGVPIMSPVTKQFRKADIDKLKRICRHLENVYIFNDNEENQSGLKGALTTASELSPEGINALITIAPRPDGVDKIDPNDVLKGIRDEPEFREYLIEHSMPYLDFLAQQAVEHKEARREDLFYSTINQALFEARRMEPIVQEEFFKNLAKKVGLRVAVVRDQFKKVIDKERSKPEFKERDEYYQESLGEEGVANEETRGHKLYKAFLSKGAKFYRPGGMDNTDVFMILDGIVYRIAAEDSPFTMYLQRTYGLSYLDHSVKKDIFEFKAHAHYGAIKMKRQTWLYCDKVDRSIYMGIGYEDNRAIKITPSQITLVHNGEDDGVFVNLPDDTIDPWTFDPGVDKKAIANALYRAVKDYSPCSDDEALLVLMTVFSFPLKRFVDTTPIIKVHGASSAGKTQIAKMVLNLFYGNERGLGDMTDASKFDQSDKRMILVFDNVENTSAGALEQFLLYSASGGGREKRDRNVESGTMKQIVDSLPILTAIHPFGKKELINRSLDITADKRFHDKTKEKKDLTVINDEFRDMRDAAMSLWAYTLQEALRGIDQTREKRNAIHRAFPNHFKERLNGFFALTWHVAEIFFGYIGWSKEEVRDLVFRWVEAQSSSGNETEKNTSTVYYFFTLLAKCIMISRGEEAIDGGRYDWIRQMLDVSDVDWGKHTVTIEGTGQELLTVFKKIARDFGERGFEYESAQKLMTRVHNDIQMLNENGWDVHLSFRRRQGNNVHRFVYHFGDRQSFFNEALRPADDEAFGGHSAAPGKGAADWV